MINLPKVLIVEDDLQLNRLLRKTFTVANLPTVSAYSLAEAVKAVRHERINIIVLDLGLPDGSGWEVVETVHLNSISSFIFPPEIIIITGQDPEAVKKAHPEVINHRILYKPFNVTELIRLAIQLRLAPKLKAKA